MKDKTSRTMAATALVVAVLAATPVGQAAGKFVLGKNSVGTAQLKKNAVTGPKIKTNAITGADVNEATLGTVPSATNATDATNATNATNANTLDNIDSTGFVRPGSAEAWHEVGAPGEPAFRNGWVNSGPGTTTAAYYKDPLDVVHLKGIVDAGSGIIFTLPAGYRPSVTGCWSTWRNGGNAYVCFFPSGNIAQSGGPTQGFMLLDGLTFRVGS
jgi:hypothetical protein